MRVFVTGASGWIGSAVIPELLAAGHRVTGLARSDTSAAAVHELGAETLRGDLDDLGTIRAGADAADAVVHLGFKHDFTRFAESGATERAVLETFIDALDGSGRPLLFAAGVAGITPGRVVTENDATPAVGPEAPRGGGEELALTSVSRGVRPVALRFAPSVHGDGDHGFRRRRLDPLGRRAPLRCRAARAAHPGGDGSGHRRCARASGGARRGRGGHRRARHRRGDRQRARPPRHLDLTRRRGSPLRLDGALLRDRHARLERPHP